MSWLFLAIGNPIVLITLIALMLDGS